jgi:ABC-type transport system involved in multi-copper enzyme maturation permease subunit
MTRSIAAELLVVRKRASTWILLGIWTLLALAFVYLVPYVQYLNGSTRQPLDDLFPQHLVVQLMAGFPFFGGVFALQLGVLAVGSEYGWGTLKTLFTQRPGRLRIFAAKLLGLAVTLVPFVLVVYALGALSSYVIALREGADVAWPSAWMLLRGLGAGWLVLAVWAALGILLAVLSRGTSLAIGIGILYSLVIEGIMSALASEVSLLDHLVQFFLRANGYSLVAALGVAADDVSDRGPGSFSGPFVSGDQALLVLASYLVALLAASSWVLRRRDVV